MTLTQGAHFASPETLLSAQWFSSHSRGALLTSSGTLVLRSSGQPGTASEGEHAGWKTLLRQSHQTPHTTGTFHISPLSWVCMQNGR